MSSPIHIDGSIGGGQILRTALSLSAVTGKPFVIDQIRARRDRPGLMRQHLTAVQATAQICSAELAGAELGSTWLEFHPGAVQAGDYHFAIATAGSACLVLQTVLPPLMVASAPSQLGFEGGTHNPLAPPYPFLDRVFFPVLERQGVGIVRSLERAGFYPAGGGRFRVALQPTSRLAALSLHERGALRRVWAEAQVVNIPHHVGTRELAVVKQRLALGEQDLLLRTPEADGPGNALLLVAEHEQAMELIVGFGERSVRAERVAERACAELSAYLSSDVPVGEHLADQLLIPFAMAGGGSFRTLPLDDHAKTNISVIEKFLPVRFECSADSAGRVTVRVNGS
jgi:RNA 3'-terminal phosphate cyclase (ATP)